MKKLVYILLATLLLAACSTTKHLPEGEVLYTGQKPMIVENRSDTKVGETAMEEVEAALDQSPPITLCSVVPIPHSFPFRTVGVQWFWKVQERFRKVDIQPLCRYSRAHILR